MDECESACSPAGEALTATNKDAQEAGLSLTEHRKLFGARLQAARKEAGQSQKDIIHLTRISPPFVQALEEGAFEVLPGEVFGRGFVKNICKVLDIDSAPLLAAYERCWEEKPVKTKSYGFTKRTAAKLRAEPRFKSLFPLVNYFSSQGTLLWVAVPAVLLLLALTLVWKLSSQSATTPATPVLAGSSASSAGVAKPQNPAASSAPASSVALSSEPAQQAPAEALEAAAAPANASSSADQAVAALPPVDAVGSQAGSSAAASSSPTTTSGVVREISPKGFSLSTQGESQSEVLIEVKEEVSIRFRLDQEAYQEELYSQGQYRFHFRDKADFFIPEMQKVAISFNKRALGEFGPHRDRKQLTFYNQELKNAVAL